MAAQHGGRRTPRNPAPVSGPGSMSRRTDGRQNAKYVSGMPYGEGQDFYDLQTSAPMSEAPAMPMPSVRGGAPQGVPQQSVTPLFAPTERPNEPLTAGASFGPGPGPATPPGVYQERPRLSDTLRKIAQVSNDPQIANLLSVAERRGW